MVDKPKTEAERLLEAVASGTIAPASVPAGPPRAGAAPTLPSDPARALFADLARTNASGTVGAPPPEIAEGTAAHGRLIAERTDPRFAPGILAPVEPTPAQKAASPVVRGLQALPDLANLIAGGLAHIPGPMDVLRSIRGQPPSRMREETEKLGQGYLSQTGGEGLIYKMARERGIVPPDPSWRPSDWLARSLYNTTDLMTQIGSGGGLTRFITGAMRRPPPEWTRRDLFVAPALGGVTGATAHAVAPQQHQELAEGYGMALGAMSPYALPRVVGTALDRAFNLFRSPPSAETGQRLASIVGRDPETLLDEYRRGLSVAPSIEGWAPSPGTVMAGIAEPGERSAAAALLGQERRAADTPTPIRDPLDRSQTISPAELRARNTQALQEEMRAGRPEGVPQAAIDEMTERVGNIRQRAQQRAGQLQGQAEGLETEAARAQNLVDRQLPPTAPGERTQARAGAAQRVYGALEEAEERAVVHGGQLFDAVDPERTARVPMYRLRDALDEVKRLAIERGRTDAIPRVMIKPKDDEGRILGDKVDDFLHNWEYQPPNPQFLAHVPYERVKGLRSRLTTAQRQAVDPQEREFYGMLIQGVDNAVAESAQGTLAARYAAARDFWRENVALPYRTGPVATILKREKEYTGAGQLFAPGERGGQNMAQIAAQVRADPDLYRATVDYARADMTAFATDVNGRVNGAKLKEWIDKHQPALRHFPELQQEFNRLSQAQRTADQWFEAAQEQAPALRALAEKGIRNTEDAIRRSAARFYLNAEPEDVVRGILSVKGNAQRRRSAEQAMAMLRTREGREGLQRAYYDYVVRRALGGEERIDPKGGWKNTFTKILDAESDIAEVLLPAQVRDRMKRLERAAVMAAKRDEARANVGSRTAEDLSGGDPGDLSVMHRLVQSLRGDLPTALGGATAGAIAGSTAGPLGTTIGGAAGAAGAYLGRHLMLARTAAREAALREALFDGEIFERAMSSASLDPVVRRRIGDKIKPYILIANTEAANAE